MGTKSYLLNLGPIFDGLIELGKAKLPSKKLYGNSKRFLALLNQLSDFFYMLSM